MAMNDRRSIVCGLAAFPLIGTMAALLPSNLVQVYDPATSRWSLGPTLPQPIHHTHVAAVGGKLYLIGGEVDGASTGGPEKYVAKTWGHDPAVGGGGGGG